MSRNQLAATAFVAQTLSTLRRNTSAGRCRDPMRASAFIVDPSRDLRVPMGGQARFARKRRAHPVRALADKRATPVLRAILYPAPLPSTVQIE